MQVASTITSLAGIYEAEGKYAEAEPLLKRSLTIREKVLGPGAPELAQSLESYAALLRKTERGAEAEKLESRAKSIRATQSGAVLPQR